MREEILEMIPEIDWIIDEDLHEKTLKCWERAITEGGWKIEDLNSIPFTLLIENTKVSIIEHTRGVTQVAKSIADALLNVFTNSLYKIDYDVLIAGALLHDIGKLLEYEKKDGKIIKSRNGKYLRHPFSGQALCYAEGIDDAILHCIAVHAKEGEGQRVSTEAIIINKADFACFEPLKL